MHSTLPSPSAGEVRSLERSTNLCPADFPERQYRDLNEHFRTLPTFVLLHDSFQQPSSRVATSETKKTVQRGEPKPHHLHPPWC